MEYLLGGEYRVVPEYKRLMAPLLAQEYAKLEAEIISKGCTEAVTIWHNNVVDGIERYEICRRHKMEYPVAELDLQTEEEVMTWICSKQLQRRNLTIEMRKYLIGTQFESTRKVLLQKEQEYRENHADAIQDADDQSWRSEFSITDATMKIAVENKIVYGTVKKYALYAKSLEMIEEKDPVLVPKILSGRYKISHENVVKLAELDEREIQKFSRQIEISPKNVVRVKKRRKRVFPAKEELEKFDENAVSVKDMPEFDPDAEITGLTLTIPSWASSLDRIRTRTDLTIVSDNAREQLIDALLYLSTRVTDMLYAVRSE